MSSESFKTSKTSETREQCHRSYIHFYTVNKSSLKKHDEIKKNCEINPEFYETCCWHKILKQNKNIVICQHFFFGIFFPNK